VRVTNRIPAKGCRPGDRGTGRTEPYPPDGGSGPRDTLSLDDADGGMLAVLH